MMVMRQRNVQQQQQQQQYKYELLAIMYQIMCILNACAVVMKQMNIKNSFLPDV